MSEATPNTIPSGRIRLTYEDYLALPDDGKRYEIIEGNLHVTPAPTPRHQRISSRIEMALSELVTSGQGELLHAPIDVLLDEGNVIQPDIIFICKDNLDIVGKKNIQGAPDLVIEILSPSTRRRDVLIKSALYARFRVPHYWIVDPDLDRVEIFGLSGENDSYDKLATFSSPETLRAEGFPGLKIPLEGIFP